MYEKLVARLLSTQKVISHPVRIQEISLFAKLLYRHNSQHHRTRYFQHLFSVRKCARSSLKSPIADAVVHVMEAELESILQPRRKTTLKKKAFKARKAGSGHLSNPSDHHKLLSQLEPIITDAIDIEHDWVQAILHASNSITQIISQSYFLPMAITFLAILSRMYAIESRVLIELKALKSELQIVLTTLLPQSTHLVETSATGLYSIAFQDNDLGELLDPGKPRRPKAVSASISLEANAGKYIERVTELPYLPPVTLPGNSSLLTTNPEISWSSLVHESIDKSKRKDEQKSKSKEDQKRIKERSISDSSSSLSLSLSLSDPLLKQVKMHELSKEKSRHGPEGGSLSEPHVNHKQRKKRTKEMNSLESTGQNEVEQPEFTTSSSSVKKDATDVPRKKKPKQTSEARRKRDEIEEIFSALD